MKSFNTIMDHWILSCEYNTTVGHFTSVMNPQQYNNSRVFYTNHEPLEAFDAKQKPPSYSLASSRGWGLTAQDMLALSYIWPTVMISFVMISKRNHLCNDFTIPSERRNHLCNDQQKRDVEGTRRNTMSTQPSQKFHKIGQVPSFLPIVGNSKWWWKSQHLH